MRSLPPFCLGLPVPPELYIDRVEELKQINLSLIAKHHVLIYGPRRIGKTSTLIKEQSILRTSNATRKKQRVFELYLGYFMEPQKNLLALFRGLVLNICYAVLEQEHKTKVPLLKAHHLKSLKDTIAKDRRILIEIYEGLKSDRTISLTESGKVGVEAYAVGTKEEAETIQFQDVAPDYRDLQSMLDLILSILNKSGYASIVLFIDDINGNLEILLSKEGTQLLQVLAEKSVIIVTSVWDKFLANKTVRGLAFFDTVVLNEFKSSKAVGELVSVYTNPPHYDGPKLDFSKDIIELIWKVTQGHPQFIQELCYRCYDTAFELGTNNVSKEMIYEIALELIRQSHGLYIGT